jgi:tetratricopeptide (TPR) repeat protein
VILRVNLETNAHKAGLQEGDMIVALEGTPITSAEQLTRYFQSLKKKGDDFRLSRRERPSAGALRRGRVARADTDASEAAYTHYLSAQDGFGGRGAITEYTQAIELAPEFDQAYVQRGKAYAEEYSDEQAAADLDKALELDPSLAEAHRERASFDLYRDNDATLANLREAMALDGCETGFKDYNYDCYLDHVLAANAYGGGGETDDYERAVAEAIEAITFYPEMANAYYLAAYYLWNLGREDEARDYAATYVEVAEESEEPPYYIEWAKYVVSGTNAFAERRQQFEDYRASTPAEAFITESPEDDFVPDGPPVVTLVTFAQERTLEEPPGQLTVTFDRARVWAYFKFDNAADAKRLGWSWTQNGLGYGGGDQAWPGINKGEAWIQLENQVPGEPSANVLTIWLDNEEVATATLHIGNDAYVGPLWFYHDAETTQQVLFFDGQPSLVYAKAHYASLPVGTELSWTAERNGVTLASGSFEVNDTAQTVFPIALQDTGPAPSTSSFSWEARWRERSACWSPADITASPLFTSFEYGTGYDYEDGISATGAKEFSVNESAFGYVIQVPPSVGRLSVRWTKDGRPLGQALRRSTRTTL